MAISKDDYNRFIDRLNKTMGKYPSVLSDRQRFHTLSQDNEFIEENDRMYKQVAAFLILFPEKLDGLSPDDLKYHLNNLSHFVEKWHTRPISSWLYTDEVDHLQEAMERLFNEFSKYSEIKVYPWTTKKELGKKFDLIRQECPSFQLRSDLYAANFKIKALRDANWSWSEISHFLSSGSEGDHKLATEIAKRDIELKNMGKTETERDKILDQEFPFEDFDRILNESLNYDAIRKRKNAADNICEKVMQYFEIGK